MQFIADILKKISDDGLITKADLYNMKELEVIDLILNSKYGSLYTKVIEAPKVKKSKGEPKDVYYVHHGAKIRYINPLINGKRIADECKIASSMIEKNLSYEMDDYIFIDNVML